MMMAQKFKLDGVEISEDSLSDPGKNILQSLIGIEAQLNEMKNIKAIFTKAKKAYISELKAEILSQKAGLDF